MHYQRTVLPNGVRVLSAAAAGAYGARLRFSFQAGAALETDELAGLAHLTEHMPFKGSLTRDARAIARGVERHGGEIDAYTDHYETTYLAIAPGPALGPIFAIAADMLRQPRLDPADIERERAVVLEELATYADEPAAVAYQSAITALWRGWPQGRPVAGSVATVSGLGAEQIRTWLTDHYGADRLVIAAAGAIDDAEVVALAQEHFADLAAVGPRPLSRPTPSRTGPAASLIRRDGEQVAICLCLPAVAETDPQVSTADLLTMVLGGNDCSRLFVRLRDELGLVYGIDASLETGPTSGQIVISTECTPRSVPRVLAEISAVLDDLMAAPPALTELTDAAAALRARWLLPFDNPLSYADWLAGRELWHGRLDTPTVVADRFTTVTPELVQALAQRCLAPASRHLALVGPLASRWQPEGWPTVVRMPRPASGRARPAAAG